jgi:hypothetical protein
MSELVNVLAGILAGFVMGLVFGIVGSNWLDDARVSRGHFEHKGQIYIITPGQAVPR